MANTIMRLLQRPPETPSLETWLGRDVPHERELAGALLAQMGREKALTALLVIHDRKVAQQEKQRRTLLKVQAALTALGGWFICAAWQWPGLFYTSLVIAAAFVLFTTAILLLLPLGYVDRRAQLKNVIEALFDYDDSPRVAVPLCHAIDYYRHDSDKWKLYGHLTRVLPLLSNDKDALSKTARALLRSQLEIIFNPLSYEENQQRVWVADFQISILRYFASTNDRAALPAIRKLLKRVSGCPVYFDDGMRIQEAARTALLAYSETDTPNKR